MAVDRYNLDSHKLKYHYNEISDFMKYGQLIAPIYVEISPSAFCNHRCTFCNFNYLGHNGKFPEKKLLSLVEELAAIGTKSIVFAGVGEPLLHKDTIQAIGLANKLGLDVGLSTNGALLKDNDFEILAKSLTWIRFSFNGGTPENYALIHKTNVSEYNIIKDNISKLVKAKEVYNTNITIGVQYVLLEENKDVLISHIHGIKDLGIDYFVVKHFYDHDENMYKSKNDFIRQSDFEILHNLASEINNDKFNLIIRDKENLNKNRIYNQCFGLDFIAYIREDGNVYTCFAHQHDNKTQIGNIFENSFKNIWDSKTKFDTLNYINQCIDKNSCQANCRHHQINQYLWDLKYPNIEHINFI